MIQKITIQNFRQFDYLEIKDLKRVNFFVGENNCGKSTILEALFLIINPQNVESPVKIALFRGMNINQEYLTNLFRNLDEHTPIDLSMSLGREKIKLHIAPQIDDTISFDTMKKEKRYDYNTTFIGANNNPTYCTSVLQITNTEVVYHGNRSLLNKFGQGIFLSDAIRDNTLNELIKKIFQSSKENILFENMRFFDLDIQSVLLIGNDIYIDTKDHPRLPYHLMGDGFKKYLRIISALISDNVNYVFLDEIENGLHFKNIKNILEAILKLSKEKNIQIFITTHSYEVLADLSKIIQEKEFINQKEEVEIINIANTKNKGYQAYNYSMDNVIELISKNSELRN